MGNLSKLEAMLAERSMSKRQLASASGVSYRTVCRVMGGKRLGNLDTWMRFAEALGCELSDIVD